MLRIKNKSFIKSILITLSLVITFSFGLLLFKNNVNCVSVDSDYTIELDNRFSKITSSNTAPIIDSTYFDVKSSNWVEKFDFLTFQDYNSGSSSSYLYFGILNGSSTEEFYTQSNFYHYVYYYSYDTSNNRTLSSKSNLLSMSWGYSENSDVVSLTFGITDNSSTRAFFITVYDYVIVTMYDNRYFITCSPSLYSSYNSYISGLTGSSLTENELYQSGYNVGYNKGFNDGNNNVKNNPNNYGLYTETQYNNNYTSGKNDGTTIGQDNVKNNPNDYGLYTETQYNNNYTNGKNYGYSTGYTAGINDSNDYTFIGLIGSVIDAPIKAFTGLFNFDLLGFNLLNFVKALFTLIVIIIVARFILAKV